MVRLSVWMPFGKAVKLLSDITGVQVSEPTARRQTEAAGAAYEQWQNQQADHLCGVEPNKNRCSSSAQRAAEQGKKAQKSRPEEGRTSKKSRCSSHERTKAETA